MKTIIGTLLLTIIVISQISAQITFKVTANKSSYSYGELIEVKATLTNNTDSSLSLYGSSTCFMTLGFNSIVFSTPCTADYNDFSMPPGSSRAWIWKLDPAALGIPDKDGSQTIRCRCIGTKDLHFNPTTFSMQDSVIVKAPKFYGGKIVVSIKPFIPKGEIQRLRDSLNASVLKSYSLSDSTVIEDWQVVNHSIDSIAQFYSKDYRLLSIAVARTLLSSGICDTITPPEAPKLLLPADGSSGQPIKLNFTWNLTPSAYRYRLQLSADTLFTSNLVDDSTLEFRSKEINGLMTGMKYFWRVSAENYSGSGKYSKVSSFTTMLPPPDSLKAANKDFRKIEITWNDRAENESGFILERKTSEEASYKTLDTLKPNITSYTDSTILPPATYLYRLKSFTYFTCSEYSNTASVNSLTGIYKKINVPEEFSLAQNYPNPFNPSTTISYTIPEKSYVNLKVYNMLGSEVAELVKNEQSAGEYKIQFNAASLPSGIYIYTIQAGQFRAIRKLLFLK